jgi:hypothetical protein
MRVGESRPSAVSRSTMGRNCTEPVRVGLLTAVLEIVELVLDPMVALALDDRLAEDRADKRRLEGEVGCHRNRRFAGDLGDLKLRSHRLEDAVALYESQVGADTVDHLKRENDGVCDLNRSARRFPPSNKESVTVCSSNSTADTNISISRF